MIIGEMQLEAPGLGVMCGAVSAHVFDTALGVAIIAVSFAVYAHVKRETAG